MKLLLKIVLFLIISGTLQSDNLELPNLQNLSNDLLQSDTDESRGNCIIATQINSTNVPFNITTAGSYCVVENITFASTNAIIISVNASNVVLDLNDQTISGGGTSLNAIQVNNQSNVTIRNGSLINFTANGVFLSQGCQQVNVSNMLCVNNNSGFAAAGVNRCSFQNCFAILNRGFGFNISNGTATASQNSTLSNCLALSTGIGATSTGPGFIFTNCLNFFINNCIAYGNRGNGFQQTLCSGFVYEQCISSGNINSGHGFSIENNNTSLESCIADNNLFDGFRCNCNQISIENCRAKNNRNGYNFEGGANGVVLNNLAQRNNAAGFTLGLNTRAIQVRSNTATGNITFGFNDIATLPPLNKFYANFANNNGTNFNGIPNFFVSPLPATPINFTTNIAE
jgi:hypothetical protein